MNATETKNLFETAQNNEALIGHLLDERAKQREVIRKLASEMKDSIICLRVAINVCRSNGHLATADALEDVAEQNEKLTTYAAPYLD